MRGMRGRRRRTFLTRRERRVGACDLFGVNTRLPSIGLGPLGINQIPQQIHSHMRKQTHTHTYTHTVFCFLFLSTSFGKHHRGKTFWRPKSAPHHDIHIQFPVGSPPQFAAQRKKGELLRSKSVIVDPSAAFGCTPRAMGQPEKWFTTDHRAVESIDFAVYLLQVNLFRGWIFFFLV